MSFFKINEDYNPEEPQPKNTKGGVIGEFAVENGFDGAGSLYLLSKIEELEKRVKKLEERERE